MYVLTFNPNKIDVAELQSAFDYIKQELGTQLLAIPEAIHLHEYDIDDLITIQKAMNDYIDFLIGQKEQENKNDL